MNSLHRLIPKNELMIYCIERNLLLNLPMNTANN